jgi:hypothetical protein
MGLVKGLERGIEKVVSRAFRGAASDGVKPVEIANLIRNSMDNESFSLSEGRTVAPHSFTVRLGDDDFAKAREWGLPLAQELADVALEHAEAQDYTLRDAITVTFRHDAGLSRGHVEIDASLGGPQAKPRGNTTPVADEPFEVPEGATTRVAPPEPIAPVANHKPLVPVVEVEGRRYAINAPFISIGRSSEADIQVADAGVSRKHIGVVKEGDKVLVRDLGSTNGTWLNGNKLAGDEVLTDGSVISAGHTKVTFRLLRDTERNR